MEILGLEFLLWLIFTPIAIFALYKYLTREFSFFQDQGIPGPTPLPLLGNSHRLLWHGVEREHLLMRERYGRVVGTFRSSRPNLIISDVNILRHILVKEFSSFTNRPKVDLDEPLDKMMIMAENDEWQHIRNTVSPTFSGGKLRRMNSQINRCSKTLVDKLKAKAGKPFNLKEYIGAYTMDVIASTAFGLDVDSQKEPDNPFILHMKKVSVLTFFKPLVLVRLFLPWLAPYLKKYFGITFFPRETTEFFTKIVDQALSSRTESDKKTRVDFLQLMANAHEEHDDNNNADGKTKRKGLNRNEVLGQGFIFFFAGYSTLSDTLTFILYLQALHPEIQNKVFNEIRETLRDDKDPDYDSLKKLGYLGMVIDESMRLYPVAFRLERICNKETVINGVKFKKDMIVTASVPALHMDPEAWPEPEKFDPDRFTPELKAKRDPFYWQPFGMGPRKCIGMRLALMEMKMALVHLIRHYEFKTCEITNIPIKRSPYTGQPGDTYLVANIRS